jgi:hypothetical protein
MKLRQFGWFVPAFVLMCCLRANVGWSTGVADDVVTGEVTAAPFNGEIEVGHRPYHIKSNSVALKEISSINAGDIVDLVLDGPAASNGSEVVAITRHAGS